MTVSPSFRTTLTSPSVARRVTLVAAAALVTFALAGCTPGADPSDGAEDLPQSGEETTAPEDTTDGGGAEGEGESAGRDFANETLEECVVGSWLLDGEQWLAGFEELAAGDFEGASVTGSGEIVMDIESDQQYTITADEFATTVEAAILESEFLYGITFDGVESGQWSVTESILALESGDGGSLTISAMAELDGVDVSEEIPLPEGSPWSEELTVECDADSLVGVTAGSADDPQLAFQRRE